MAAVDNDRAILHGGGLDGLVGFRWPELSCQAVQLLLG
jgi:hypothetical protein